MVEEERDSGFKFALTAIGALLTFSYMIYNYFQNSANDYRIHTFAITVITFATTSSIMFIIYIMVKGFSMEIQVPKLKIRIKDFAEDIYIASFFISLITLIYMLILFYVTLSSNYFVVPIEYIVILIGAYIYQKYILIPQKYHRLLRKEQIKIISDDKEKASDSIVSKTDKFLEKIILYIVNGIKQKLPCLDSFLKITAKIEDKTFKFVYLMLFVIIFSGSQFLLLFVIMQGHITTDVASIYHKNEQLIPVSIAITGPKSDFSINLSKGDSNHDIYLIDSIEFKQIQDPNKMGFSKNLFLFGNEMQNGVYNIFINTTNLTEGYYELAIKPKYRKGFYLLNVSKTDKNIDNELNSTK